MDAKSIEYMGILANAAYDNSLQSGNYIATLPQYKIIATQNELIGSLFPNAIGFQGMLLQDIQSGKYVIAFRGTEGDLPPTYQTFADLATDISMAVGNFPMQMQLALAFVNAALDQYGNQGLTTANLTLTGHSLGGSLAEVASYTFGSETYAYNPFGVNWSLVTSPATYNATLMALGLTSVHNIDNISNIVNVSGNFTDLITGVGSHLLNSYIGSIKYVKNSEGGTFAPHGMDALNESIAVYNKLIEIFPSVTYESLTELLDVIQPADKQVPSFLESLGTIVGTVNPGNPVDFAESIKNSVTGVLSLVTLGEKGDAELASLAKGDKAYAYAYALLHLNSFAVTGLDYSSHTEVNDQNLAEYTDQFWGDRALFLYQLTHPSEPSSTDMHFNFTDFESGITAQTLDSYDESSTISGTSDYIFGSDAGESISCGSINSDDHLYGMGGNDSISGGRCDDYLEGGRGDDTFGYQGTDNGVDNVDGGEGIDNIVGSKFDDTIRFNRLTSDNSIQKIDGGEGNDTISGTDLANTIDLSNTIVENIEQIDGGTGNDILIGSQSNDHLIGGTGSDILQGGMGNDTLEGGDGNDTYIYKPGDGNDTLIDSDGMGKILLTDASGTVAEAASGNFTQTGAGSNQWTSSSGNITLTQEATWLLSFADGGSIDLGTDFKNGQFGINMVDTPAAPQIVIPPGDEKANFLFDGSTVGQEIYAKAERDLVIGSTGDDILDGGAGNDWIAGRGGADTHSCQKHPSLVGVA